MVTRRRRNLDLILGIFVIVGITLLTFSIVVLGRERKTFERKVQLKAYYENVIGLSKGADVQLGGLLAGHVSSIEFPTGTGEGPEAKQIEVSLQISASLLPFIREDSIARIEGKGLLGDRIINITMGSPSKPAIQEDSVLPSASPVDLNEAVTEARDAISNFSETAAHAKEIFKNFSKEGGEKSLAQGLVSLKNIISEIEHGEGIIHQLVYDKNAGQDFKNIAHKLSVLSEKLDGIAQQVDKKDINAIMKDVSKAANDLQSIIAGIKNGEGTIGKLIVDPTPYEKLLNILGGAEESTILKMLIRNAGKESK